MTDPGSVVMEGSTDGAIHTNGAKDRHPWQCSGFIDDGKGNDSEVQAIASSRCTSENIGDVTLRNFPRDLSQQQNEVDLVLEVHQDRVGMDNWIQVRESEMQPQLRRPSVDTISSAPLLPAPVTVVTTGALAPGGGAVVRSL